MLETVFVVFSFDIVIFSTSVDAEEFIDRWGGRFSLMLRSKIPKFQIFEKIRRERDLEIFFLKKRFFFFSFHDVTLFFFRIKG